MTGTYLIPGKKTRGQMLEGWQLNSALNILSGVPVGAFDTTSDLSGTGEQDDRWDMFGNPSQLYRRHPCNAPVLRHCHQHLRQDHRLHPGRGSLRSYHRGSESREYAGSLRNPAASLPVNPSVPASDPNATGLASLSNFGCISPVAP